MSIPLYIIGCYYPWLSLWVVHLKHGIFLDIGPYLREGKDLAVDTINFSMFPAGIASKILLIFIKKNKIRERRRGVRSIWK